MTLRFSLLLIFFLTLTACNPPDEPAPSTVQNTVSAISYHQDIQPILTQKCIACHACFDAPCQLKLESGAGLERGAATTGVYDAKRKEAVLPTRLGVDATTPDAWRDKGFHTVLGYVETRSLLLNMIELGHEQTFSNNQKLPDDLDISIKRENTCPLPNEFNEYKDDNPMGGMPFAVNGLTEKEFDLISNWIFEGAAIDNDFTADSIDEDAVSRWEGYLNRESNQHRLVSRWLYEHLFLAHLYFEEKGRKTQYYELVRSYTPPGEPIKIVQTRLPNELPTEGDFYYRIRPLQQVIVHKRHITFQLNADEMAFIDQHFFGEDWQADVLPHYGYDDRANPFRTFLMIPATARYAFLLRHAEYFVRTFIRGPVCRGQIATDVIRDQFWVMFQKPERDLFITDKAYQRRVIPLLGLPGQDDDLLSLSDEWSRYKDRRNAYLFYRDEAYSAHAPLYNNLDSIWDGEGSNPNALLTVFRHFDNASVQKGFIGQQPKTVWWMDFPLFERTYYELVVNFDVFGNVAHQLQTRLYFDLIRNGAEHNFLRLLPADTRETVLKSWYEGLGILKTHITYAPLDVTSTTGITYHQDDVKQELLDKVLTHLADVNLFHNDRLNRCQGEACHELGDSVLTSLAPLNQAVFDSGAGVDHLPELSFLRVSSSSGQGERRIFSLVRNRDHSNVAFLFGESLRYRPKNDSLTLIEGIAGSYPNFIFNVTEQALPDLVSRLNAECDTDCFDNLVTRYGVRRTHPQFWSLFNDVTAWQYEQAPLQAGVFDMNRYENL
jgi:hypothetical protein